MWSLLGGGGGGGLWGKPGPFRGLIQNFPFTCEPLPPLPGATVSCIKEFCYRLTVVLLDHKVECLQMIVQGCVG